MRATSDVFPGKPSKPALHLIEPRCRRWGEVNMEPRVSSEPVFDRRRLVRAVVIHHQMNFQSGGHAGLDRAQELQEFTAAMATVQFTDDFPCGNVQRGKQSGGAVAHRVVSTALGNAGRQRQYGLRTIEGLDLALLVNTKHHRLEGRVEVQADDIANLVDEQRVARKFEGLLQGLCSEPRPAACGLGVSAGESRAQPAGTARNRSSSISTRPNPAPCHCMDCTPGYPTQSVKYPNKTTPCLGAERGFVWFISGSPGSRAAQIVAAARPGLAAFVTG